MNVVDCFREDLYKYCIENDIKRIDNNKDSWFCGFKYVVIPESYQLNRKLGLHSINKQWKKY